VTLAGLILQALFLGLAFGLRTYLHRRRTGTTGFRVGAHRGAAEAVGAGGITVAAVASLVATVLALAGVLGPIGLFDHDWLRWIGAAVALGGLILVLAAQTTMGASWRIGVDQAEVTDLVTAGLFSVTRNPIFLGMLIFWLGMAALVPSALSLVAFVVALLAVEAQVRLVEEPYLIRTHGAAYLAYASRTGRLLPGLGRIRRDGVRARIGQEQ
jgi:protein-S-isoprenylcysteine O-methyltransferase Ste14